MRRLFLFLALLAGAAPGAAGAALQISYVPASPSNYARAPRPASAIREIVVHVTEGTYPATISWFRNPSAHVSSHYVVSRDGAVTQMVPNSRIAWHAGNPWANAHSIGVEDEGFTAVDATFTDAEYRASAELVAGLLRRYLLPIDRRHVIGHNEVPDPFRRGLFGGYAHHTDPGKYWDWKRYMTYIRSYAHGVIPPALPFDVATAGPRFGQTVAGAVPWSAAPTGLTADRVDFYVDAKLRDTERAAPYAFSGGSWDSTQETNGRHVLTLRATATTGARATSAIVVTVKNPAIRVTDLTPVEGEIVTGTTAVQPHVTGTPLRVEFLVDGVLRDTETVSPYAFAAWDTTKETDGPHALTVRAVGPSGKAASTRTVHVTVANG